MATARIPVRPGFFFAWSLPSSSAATRAATATRLTSSAFGFPMILAMTVS